MSMVSVSEYWRPASMEEARGLLARPGAVALAGGTRLNSARPVSPVELVDLQALGLAEIERQAGTELRLGAMATLQQVVDCDAAPEVVREAARREEPSTLRAQATVGGCVATGDAESELLAALLVHEAVVHLVDGSASEEVPLEELLAGLPLAPGRLVTAVTLRVGGRTAAVRTARTPADRPIVAAVVRADEGVRRLALTGVAPTPVLVQPGDPVDPVGDFRASAAYRRALAEVLVARALEAIA